MKTNRLLTTFAALAAVVVTCALTASAQYTEAILYKFTAGLDGGNPMAGLTFDTQGNLYGTTYDGGAGCASNGGCGAVFELSPTVGGGWTETVLYSFQGGTDGAYPQYGVTLDAQGNIYGFTVGGGAGNVQLCGDNGCGVAFELTPNVGGGWTEQILHVFTGGSDGIYPGKPLLDSKGNLYSIASGGGSGCDGYGCGMVFELSPSSSGWTEKILYDFTGGADGVNPVGGLVFDAAGNMYGTTNSGGTSTSAYCVSNFGCGTVFRLSPAYNGRQFRVLYEFQGSGGFPLGSLVVDNAGNLYGVADQGSRACAQSGGCGSVFKLSPTTQRQWKLTLLHSFTGMTDQFAPNPVILDSSGNLFGTTYSPATFTGTAFELTPTSTGQWAYSRLIEFSTSGDSPLGSLVFDAAGNLFGTTEFGGAGCGGFGCGTVFELSPPASSKN